MLLTHRIRAPPRPPPHHAVHAADEVLNEYMRVRCLPKPLRERLRQSLRHSYPNKRIFPDRALLAEFAYPPRGQTRPSLRRWRHNI